MKTPSPAKKTSLAMQNISSADNTITNSAFLSEAIADAHTQD
jgi:hypothetical protein